MNDEKQVRHILSLSGGKDSTALAVYMRERLPDVEYVFCDTGEELRETYKYLDTLEALLQKPIVRLRNNRQGFKDLLEARRGFLPSPKARWCTQYLKIVPFEEYVGDSQVINYIAIRADESHRRGYISAKKNIQARYPFIEDGLAHRDILRLLSDSGLELPDYYRWRSRSGCYFCFFQQVGEWIGLLKHHPDLYWKAAGFERTDPVTGERYTWRDGESLAELARPERVAVIEARSKNTATRREDTSGTLLDLFDTDSDDEACIICQL